MSYSSLRTGENVMVMHADDTPFTDGEIIGIAGGGEFIRVRRFPGDSGQWFPADRVRPLHHNWSADRVLKMRKKRREEAGCTVAVIYMIIITMFIAVTLFAALAKLNDLESRIDRLEQIAAPSAAEIDKATP